MSVSNEMIVLEKELERLQEQQRLTRDQEERQALAMEIAILKGEMASRELQSIQSVIRRLI